MSVETVRPDTERRAERTGRREEDHATRGDDAGAGERRVLPVRSADRSGASLPVRGAGQGGEPTGPRHRPRHGAAARPATRGDARAGQPLPPGPHAPGRSRPDAGRGAHGAGRGARGPGPDPGGSRRVRRGPDRRRRLPGPDRRDRDRGTARGPPRPPAGVPRCAESSTPAPCAPTSAPSPASPSSRSCCGASAPASSWTGCAGSTAPPCWRRSAIGVLTTVFSAWRWRWWPAGCASGCRSARPWPTTTVPCS